MSDTKAPSDMPSEPPCLVALATLFLLVSAAIFVAFKLFQRLKKTTNTPDTKEPPYMTELLARAAKHLPRPQKCSTTQEQQDACEQILYTHFAVTRHRHPHFAESNVERVVRRTL
jgi:hypothetical protein